MCVVTERQILGEENENNRNLIINQHVNMKQLPIYLTAIFLAVTIYFIGVSKSPQSNSQLNTESFGSVSQTSEYHATTTHPNTQLIVPITTTTGNFYANFQGTLGSVIITKAGAAMIEIFDATTTVASQRAASMTTNTIRLASFPASVAAGTYTFDEVFFNGLMVVYSSNDIPTNTLTWR